MRVLGKEMIISKERMDAALLIGDLSNLGRRLSKQFTKEFFETCKDLDNALIRIKDLSAPYYIDAVKHTVDILIQNKIYHIDQEELLHYLSDEGYFDFWNEVISGYIDQYNKIEKEKKLQNDYRKNRKDTRERIVGGGFGWEGAVKGMVTAAAINGGIGLVHSAVNAIGNLGTAINAENVKEEIYEQMRNYVPNTMYETIKLFSFALMVIISNETGCIYEVPTEQDCSKSKSITNNVITSKVPKENRLDAILEAIVLNPNNTEAFHYLALAYGDSNNEIERLGSVLGNDIHQIKIEGFIRFGLNRIKSEASSLRLLEDSEYVAKLKELQKYLSTQKKHIGLSEMTLPEINLENAIKKCEMGLRVRGKESEDLTLEKREIDFGKTRLSESDLNKKILESKAAIANDVTTVKHIDESYEQRLIIIKEKATKCKGVGYKVLSRIIIDGIGGIYTSINDEEKNKYRKAYCIPEDELIFTVESNSIIGIKTGYVITSGAIYSRHKGEDGTPRASRVSLGLLDNYMGFRWVEDKLYCDDIFLLRCELGDTRKKAATVVSLQMLYIIIHDIYPEEKDKPFQAQESWRAEMANLLNQPSSGGLFGTLRAGEKKLFGI